MIERRKIMNESLKIVITGLISAYPISLFVIFLCIDVFQYSSVITSTINTFVLTLVAVIRVYFIRLHTEKNK